MNLSLFIMAGYETTSSTLNIVFYLLAKYPEEQQKVYEELCIYFPPDENANECDKHIEFENLDKLEYMAMFIKESRHAVFILKN